MHGTNLVAIVVALVPLTGCMSMPPVVKRGQVPAGAEIAVIMFRDCVITGQEDCDGSGNTAGSIFARTLATGAHKAVPVSRPVDRKESLSDDAAVTYARSKGFRYVLNGEVDEYYRVAPFTYRAERAGISVRLLQVSDGAVVAFFSQRTHSATNLTTPDKMIEAMAEHF